MSAEETAEVKDKPVNWLETLEKARKSDTDTDNSVIESDDDSADTNSEEIEETQEDSEEVEVQNDDSEDSTESDELDFDFRSTQSSIERLATKFKAMSAEEKAQKVKNIEKSGRTKELEALKEADPDYFNHGIDNNLALKIDQMVEERLAEKLREADDAFRILDELKSAKPELESQLKNRMLKDVFGGDYTEVADDPKFVSAMIKYDHLDLEERLEVACLMSPVARKLKTEAGKPKKKIPSATPTGKAPTKEPPKEKTPQQSVSVENWLDTLGKVKRR